MNKESAAAAEVFRRGRLFGTAHFFRVYVVLFFGVRCLFCKRADVQLFFGFAEVRSFFGRAAVFIAVIAFIAGVFV